MPDAATLAQVIKVVRTQFPGAPNELNAHSTAADVDGWDSVSHAMLVLALEDAFGCEIDFERTIQVSDFGGLADAVDDARKSQEA